MLLVLFNFSGQNFTPNFAFEAYVKLFLALFRHGGYFSYWNSPSVYLIQTRHSVLWTGRRRSNYSYRLNHCHVIWTFCIFFFYFKAWGAAVSLSRTWYPQPRIPCGSSTKCLRTVTLQSSRKRHWLHTSCNLMQTRSGGEGMCLCVTRGTDSLARSVILFSWRDLPQLTALWLCPWTERIQKEQEKGAVKGWHCQSSHSRNRFF